MKSYIWTIALYGTENVYNPESRSDIPGTILNVVLEKGGEDHLNRSCEK